MTSGCSAVAVAVAAHDSAQINLAAFIDRKKSPVVSKASKRHFTILLVDVVIAMKFAFKSTRALELKSAGVSVVEMPRRRRQKVQLRRRQRI